MVGILIITHGTLSEGLMDSLRLIMGEQEAYATLSLRWEDSIEELAESIKSKVLELESGSGVLVLVDLFSASPFNQAAIALHSMNSQSFRLISGVNLPMLIEVFNQRMIGLDLNGLYVRAMEAGKEGIKELAEEIKQNKT